MNAQIRKKTRGHAAAGLMLAAALVATGCASAPPATSEQPSPLSARIQTLVEANRHYPRWADFPTAPQDLPQTAQIAASLRALERQSETLGSEVARIDWTLGDAEAVAAETRAQVGAAPVSVDAARTAAEIEAFAQSLRERAKAPPPIDRRPVP